jgi:hypothetical protein
MTSKRFICITTSVILAVLCVLLVITKTAMSTTSTTTELQSFENATPNIFAWVQTPDDRPIEQTRKNIQVLKGVRESQLFLLMHTINASLDVQCDHCHVQGTGKGPDGRPLWHWESDDKPKKLMARKCMKLVAEINSKNFGGETAVTCHTCHRGSLAPMRVPPLPPHDPDRTKVALPTAAQVLSKYYAAIGGKEAASKFKTIVMKGTVERSEGRNSQIEVTLKEADKYLIIQTSPQGVMTLGVNGEDTWTKTGNNPVTVTRADLERLRRNAFSYYTPIRGVEQATQLKVLGIEKVGDRDTYVLSFALDPETTRKLYFDTQTGLLLRTLTTIRTMIAHLPEQVDLDDYRDVDGVKLPFTIRTSNTATWDTATRRFTEIRRNVAVDDTVFNQTGARR